MIFAGHQWRTNGTFCLKNYIAIPINIPTTLQYAIIGYIVGSPLLSHQEPATREKLAGFLERILHGSVEQHEWDGFVQTQYQDELLETIRRCVVDLKQNRLPVKYESDEGKQALRAWVLVLRAEPANENTLDVPKGVILRLSPEEAVILDAFLYRFSETDELSFQHCVEERVLFNLQSILEREVTHPNLPSIEDARRVILGGDN